jgi:hypothetical protein
MMKRVLSGAACLLIVASVWTLSAQESVTIVTRSGDRIAGELLDLGAVGFTMRVNGQERRIQPSDVATIEFTGATPPNDDVRNRLNAGQQFVVLRNGQIIEGRLNDIGGSYPLRLTFEPGARDLNSSEVAVVYLAPGPGMAAAAPVPAPGLTPPGSIGPGRTISVPATQQWTSAGFNVRQGQTLYLQTSGQIQFSPDSNDRAESAGNPSKRVPGAPLPNAFAGALIGRVGNGQPFAVGNLTELRAPANGQLFLGINDDNVSDNAGQFQVSISTSSSQGRRR